VGIRIIGNEFVFADLFVMAGGWRFLVWDLVNDCDVVQICDSMAHHIGRMAT